ncbi:hypothetical protein [Thermoanaerobacter thermohydrosulfuricus]|nr:hypothetical protein [Thermoanaerobacter thermohydrosulfuricus]
MKCRFRCLMVQSTPSASTIRDSKKGSAVLILVLLFSSVLILANIGFVNYRLLLAQRDALEDAVTSTALAELAKTDPVKMAYGEIEILASAQDFINDLQKNIPNTLNSSYWRIDLSTAKIIIYNTPGTAPDGTYIAKPSIYADITFYIHDVFKREVPIRVKKIVSIDYKL